MNLITSTLHSLTTFVALKNNTYYYSQLSDEGKRAVKADALYSISLAATFATSTVATGLLGAYMVYQPLMSLANNEAQWGLGLLGTYAAGLFAATVAAPSNLVISHFISKHITNKYFPAPQ